MTKHGILAGLLTLLIACPVLFGQEWTRFRGPNGTGVNSTKPLPASWTKDNILWKRSIPGQGHSSPVLWGDNVFVTSSERKTGTRMVLCVDAKNGKVKWQKSFTAKKYRMHKRNSVATSTPTVDSKHVYLAWATPESLTVMALDHKGETVWEKDLGKWKGNHGYGVSPILYKDLLVLANDQDKTGSILALKSQSGDIAWKIARKSGNATYATPCVYRAEGQMDQLIFTNWQHGITAVNPDNGKTLWEMSVFEPAKKERSIASPLVADDLVIGTCGFVTAQKHFVAIKPGTKNTAPKELWREEQIVSYLPTPIILDGLIFCCTETGIAVCRELKTGDLVWKKRLDSNFYASPVSDGKHIYCVSTDGDVIVLAASRTFEMVSQNALGDAAQATPAISGGKLFIRTASQLICVGQK